VDEKVSADDFGKFRPMKNGPSRNHGRAERMNAQLQVSRAKIYCRWPNEIKVVVLDCSLPRGILTGSSGVSTHLAVPVLAQSLDDVPLQPVGKQREAAGKGKEAKAGNDRALRTSAG
jgi:hypothetical protein